MGSTLDTMLKLYDYSKIGMDITDTYINTQARLKLINDGLQTQAELQNKIFAAADRSRGSYTDMASSVTKLGTLAGNAFSSNDETIKFAELAQKSFKLGGASSEEQSSGMDQLTQGMATGNLQGGDFESIMENVPMLEQALANFTGKSIVELEKMGAEGKISADMIKGALFAASDEIDAKFGMLPMTFADVWTEIKNAGMQAFSGVMESVNKLINTDGFEDLINNLIIGMFILGAALEWVFNMATQNWGVLAPILETIGGVLLVTIIRNLWAAATAAWAVVIPWLAANWAIILVVAAIVIVINILGSLGVTVQDVFSFIGGVIGVFATYFYNQFIFMWNAVATFVNFLGNVFTNPIAAIKVLFLDMASTALGYISTLAKGIEDVLNNIPGLEVDLTSGLDGLKSKLEKESANIKSEAEFVELVKEKDYMGLSEGYSDGSNIGSNFYDSAAEGLKGLTDKLTGGADGITGFDDLGTSSNPLTVQGTGSDGTVDVDMAEEDLQYLRDIAERDYINKFSSRTLAPNIQVSFGDVHQTADVDKVAGRMQKILQEQIATTGEGVY